jgi:hypothetical protein
MPRGLPATLSAAPVQTRQATNAPLACCLQRDLLRPAHRLPLALLAMQLPAPLRTCFTISAIYASEGPGLRPVWLLELLNLQDHIALDECRIAPVELKECSCGHVFLCVIDSCGNGVFIDVLLRPVCREQLIRLSAKH